MKSGIPVFRPPYSPISSGNGTGRSGRASTPVAATQTKRGKRRMSAAARKKIAAAQKKRWAAFRKKQKAV